MHIVSTNFAKTFVWKHEYDVKLWRHQQGTPNTNDHHMPLSETPFMTQELDRNHCIHGRPQKFFQGEQCRYFAYPFQVADDAMPMNVHQTLNPFYPISLCWLNLESQFSIFCNVFYTSTIRNTFTFHKLPNIQFFERFLQYTYTVWKEACIRGSRIPHRRIQDFFRRGIKDEFIRMCIDCIAVKTNCSGKFL